MSVARRGFLRLMAAAPVAAPVVAREAAQKAGLGVVGLGVDQFGPGSSGCVPANPSSERDWLMSWCKQVFTAEWEEEKRREGKSWWPSKLDPDLAASRSLSLSAAMRIQQDRNIERRIASEREEASRRYFGLFKTEFRP
jgi:catalase (peroxidase I)